jgi:serine phosphatase RsbU (regulator of sigma subunit)
MLLFIYLFGIREKKYLWGTLFTLCLSIVLFWSTGYISTNYDVFGTILIFLSTITPYFLVEFIYSLFDFTIPKWVKKILFFGCLLILLVLILEILEVYLNQNWFWVFFTTLIIFLFTISSIFVFIGIYKAVKQRLFNAKVLLIGLTLIILLTIFWLFDNLLGNGNISVTNWYRVLHILPLPICVLIAIVRDYVASNKNLKKQLIKVEELTAQTIREKEEKQQILQNQNERLEQQVTERTREINAQKNLLQDKQKEILDSIHYAKRLQEAILPPLTFIDEHVPKNFVLYQPKDVVAGDFYWAETKDNKFFIAAADCTGHGVPGAMVSVVCSNALNRTVNEFGITDTGKILDKTRELVLETFAKGNAEVKDGMDISLLCIDKQNNKAFWSGANNSLWYVSYPVTSSEVEKSTDAGLDSARPDTNVGLANLIEIKADKQPIGKTDHAKPFTTHEIALQEGMLFYLFTDGYADQFGGPKGKKFKYKPLNELLLTNFHLPLEEQKIHLKNIFDTWKGDLEQVDDVCVIGVKI